MSSGSPLHRALVSRGTTWLAVLAGIAATLGGCAVAPSPVTDPIPARAASPPRRTSPLDGVRQLLVVTTVGWNSTRAIATRWERDDATGPWRQVLLAEPAVIGYSGLAWAHDSLVGPDPAPVKREGDGRSPAGIFPLDTVFGFRPAEGVRAAGLPYVALQPGSECVDDPASRHYNTIVDRSRVPTVDWKSSERMRTIEQYALGITVGYNAAPPRAGRGSCIFLHIWGGPTSVTTGCTAFPPSTVGAIAAWLRRDRHPTLVQLTQRDYARLRGPWALPMPPDDASPP